VSRFFAAKQVRTPKGAANEILRKSGTPRMSNGVAIDVERILEQHCGFEVMHIENLNPGGRAALGLFIPDHDIVMVEATSIEPRKRFTMAHELGHAELEYDFGPAESLFDLGETGMFECTADDEDLKKMDEHRAGRRRRKEIRANQFAANLLMPDELVREVWRDWRNASRVAQALCVSNEAIRYRLHELRILSV
jgi:Zn-dependent peptidase ImmA (M78 family)